MCDRKIKASKSGKESFCQNNDQLHKAIVFKYLKEAYTSHGFEVFFQKKSSNQSQLSIKAVASGMHMNYMSIVEELEEGMCPWKKN